jgi:hypothetical protein
VGLDVGIARPAGIGSGQGIQGANLNHINRLPVVRWVGR